MPILNHSEKNESGVILLRKENEQLDEELQQEAELQAENDVKKKPAPRLHDDEDEQERAERALDEQFEREEEEQEREVEQDEQALAEDEMPDSYEEIIEDTFEDLETLLDNKKYADFVRELEKLNPIDAADFFENLPPKRIPAVFRLLKKDSAAEVFAELDAPLQERIISAMTDREIAVIVEDLFLDDAVDMLSEMPANIVRRIKKNTTPETRAQINRLLAYPEDSAGSVMTSEFVDLRKSMTVSEAIKHIRQTGIDKETVYTAYVIDESRILEGIVSFKDLLFSARDALIGDIMEPNIIYANTLDDQETVADIIAKYNLLSLPIVDRESRLVGIVTVDDALDVIEEETTEDIEKMAAILPTDKPYMRTSVWENFKKRIPWLLLLMLTATFTGTIITMLEGKIDALDFPLVLSLSAFIPMLMSTGGNAGGQSSVTVIRALSLGEIEPKDILRVVWKEVRIAMLCGACVFVACFIKTWAYDCKFNTEPQYLMIAAAVSATVFVAIVLAKLIGAILPIGAKVIKLDPSVMASPFITTIVDTLTLLVYFLIVIYLLVPQMTALL